MLKAIKEAIENVGYKRCRSCPAYWAMVDYWGEGYEGCALYRDIDEFCSLSLLPKVIVESYVKFKEKQDEEYGINKESTE